MRNISRFRLRAHTLKVEAAAWHEDGSCVCDQCPGEDKHVQNEVHALLICQDHRVCELRKHFSFLFSPFFEDFSAAQPFLLQQVNTNLFMIFFLSRTIDFFFLCLWIYLWLAETSQQPISQTTWLKVTPHCNHKKEDTFPKIWHADTSGFVLKPGTSTLSFYDLESLTRSFHWMLVKLLTRHRQAAHYNGYTTQNYSVLCKRADTKAEKKHSAAKTSDSI